ncbi:hypothetical protein [Phaeobacter sp. NW0010-22]|uniref:hypothetical protein n=1 Tax=Phaeobacter sp. NW0010-22 TaxID=3135907 RepID=UPI003104D36B
MTQAREYHGGLVFLQEDQGSLDRFARIVSATLEDYGHSVERQSISDRNEATVVTHQYAVHLGLDSNPLCASRSHRMDAAAGLNPRRKKRRDQVRKRLTISLTPVSDKTDDRDVSELILVVMLYRMVDLYSSEHIEWLDPSVLLTVEQFLGAFANVSPQRVQSRQKVFHARGKRFAPVEDTAPGLAVQYDKISGQTPHCGKLGLVELTDEEALALAFRSDPHPDELDANEALLHAENDIRRLTSWGMTGVLAFVSGPVALSLAAVNLIRGEDFRLSTQVLTLTSALMILQGSGAMASVATYIPM